MPLPDDFQPVISSETPPDQTGTKLPNFDGISLPEQITIPDRIRIAGVEDQQPPGPDAGLAQQVLHAARGIAEGFGSRTEPEGMITSRGQETEAQVPDKDTDPEGYFGFLVNTMGTAGVNMLAGGLGEFLETAAGRGVPVEDMIGQMDLENFGNPDAKFTGSDSPLVQTALGAIERFGAALSDEANEILQRQPEPEGIMEFIGWATGQAIPLMVAATAGGVVGQRTALKYGLNQTAARLAGSMGPVYFSEKEFLERELLDAGVDPDAAEFMSALGGIPVTALEIAFESGVARRLVGKFMGEAGEGLAKGIKKTAAQRLANVAKGGARGLGLEGITEALQEDVGLAVRFAATGEAPSFDEVLERNRKALAAGAAAGGTFGAVTTFVGEAAEANREAVRQKRRAEADMRARKFDPAAAEIGTQIGNKTKVELGNGQTRWRGERGFTTAPDREEVRRHFLDQTLEAQSAADLEPTPEALEVPVPAAAREIAGYAEREVDPAVAELNIRKTAVGYRSRATEHVRELRRPEIEAEIAELEAMALEPSDDMDYATRVTAMARSRALRKALDAPNAPDQLNVSLAAVSLARMDEVDFQDMADQIQEGGNEIRLQALRQARQLKALDSELVESASDQVRERLQDRQGRRARGAAQGSTVVTGQGQVAEVLGVRPSGFLEVLFEDQDNPSIIDPANVSLIPEPSQQAQLLDGTVVDVLQVTNNEDVRIRLPDDTESIVAPTEIEKIGASESMANELTQRQTQQRADLGIEERTPLFEPAEAVDAETGQRVEVASLGAQTAELSDGTVVQRSRLTFGSDRATLADIQQTGEIPAFEPGTQPSAEGRHINFIEVPEAQVDAFESAMARGNIEAALRAGRLFLLPQPRRPGTRTYAIELPSEARNLTDASKRLLRFLGGKSVNLNPATLRAGLRLDGPVDPTQVRLMRVPSALQEAVQGGGVVNQLDSDQLRDYLRRLTDLGFDAQPEVAEAMEEAREAADAAADARIAGEAGAAEVAEIEAPVARAEAVQRSVEIEVEDKRQLWEAFSEQLREELDPSDRTKVEALNASTRDDLLQLPGIGEALADDIMAARADQPGGRFEKVEDLLRVPGIAEQRLAGIRQAIADGRLDPSQRISAQREETLKAILAEIPGRVSSSDSSPWVMSFPHPRAGLTLMIDKEMVLSARDVGRDAIPEGETIRSHARKRLAAILSETVGGEFTADGFQVIELPDGTTVERDPLAQISSEEFTELTSRAELGHRDIYHIKILTPEGDVARTRTIGHTEQEVKVPESMARGRGGAATRGFASTPPAIRAINEAASQNQDITEVIRGLRDQRREVRRVHLEGRERARGPDGDMVPVSDLTPGELNEAEVENPVYEVVSEGEQTLVVRDPDNDNTFEVPKAQVTEELAARPEDLVPVTLPRRLSDSEVLEEVMHEVREFGGHFARIASLGEWRGQAPGVYAEVRPSPRTGGYIAMIMRGDYGRQVAKPQLYEVDQYRSFETKEAAETWLEDMEFRQTRVPAGRRETFQSLPPVDQLVMPEDQTSGDPDEQVWDMVRAEDALAAILKQYQHRGWVPQPIQDYAVRFALRWRQLGLQARGGIFGDAGLRRLVGVHDVTDWPNQRAEVGKDPSRGAINVPLDTEVIADRVVVDSKSPGNRSNPQGRRAQLARSPAVEGTHPARIEAFKKLFEGFENKQRFLDMLDVSGLPATEHVRERLVKVGREQRLGIVLDAQPTSDNVTVQIFEQGEPAIVEVPKGEVVRVRDSRHHMDYYRAARDAMGELRNMPRTPEMGASPLDAKMGLDLVTDRTAYVDGLRQYVGGLVQQSDVDPEGNIRGDPGAIDNLVDAFIRMKELGIENRAEPSELTEALPPDRLQAFRDRYGPAIASAMGTENFLSDQPLIPPQLLGTTEHLRKQIQGTEVTQETERATMGPVLYEAYQQLANTFSSISPYGDVVAKAKLDLLGRRNVKRIDKQAEEFGIDPDLPTYRKVEELIQNVWDPATAHFLYQVSRERGAIQFAKDQPEDDWPEHGIEIRMPASSSSIQSNFFLGQITTPRELGNKHPTARALIFMMEKARTKTGNAIKHVGELINGLQAWGTGVDLGRKKLIRDLLEDPALGQAQDTPATILEKEQVLEHMSDEVRERFEASNPDSWDWYRNYRTMRGILSEKLYQNIRNALVRGFGVEEINFEGDPDDIMEELQFLRQDNTLNDEEYRAVREVINRGDAPMRLDRNSDVTRRRPRSEVDKFIKLMKRYRSLEEIPEDVRAQMAESQEGWMVREFDFWKRYGINNYFPHIIQGRLRVMMRQPDGEDRLVAFAPDGGQIMEFAFRAQRGEFTERGIPRDAEFYVQAGKGIADDVDMEFLGNRFSRAYAKFVKSFSGPEGEGAKLMNMVAREIRAGREPAAPRDVHLEARLSDLAEVIEDPYEAILIYAARTARNNMLLDIDHAWGVARSHDYALATAEGITPAFQDEGISTYLKELKDNFMGLPTKQAKILRGLIELANIGRRATRAFAGEIKAKLSGRDYDMWKDPAFLGTLYDADYTSRRWAENMTGIQSVLRLGFNLSGAAINATQHIMFTPAYLVRRGATVDQAIAWSIAGYKDAINYWRSVTPAEFHPVRDLAGGSGFGAAAGALAGVLTGTPAGIAAGAKVGAAAGAGLGALRHKLASDKYADLAHYAEDVGVATVPARGIAGPGLGLRGQARPIFFSDTGLLEKMTRMTEWAAMWPFASAESSVRLASSFAAKRFAEERGLGRGASVATARDVVDNTQFQYYDQALPPFMRGPIARVLFQFKQFPLNAIKFEKDLMMGSIPQSDILDDLGISTGRFRQQQRLVRPGTGKEVSAQAQSFKALMLYNMIGGVLGGGMYAAARPMLAPISWLNMALGGDRLTEVLERGLGGGEDDERRYPGPQVGDPALLLAEDFMLYGLPGLLGINISQRLGVSGLEFDPMRARDLLLGPTGSLWSDILTALLGEEGFVRVNRPATLFGLGAGALSQLNTRTRYPMSFLVHSLAATELGSLAHGMPFHQYAMDTEPGRVFLRDVNMRLGRGIAATIDIFSDGDFIDARGQKRSYPAAFNRGYESAAALTGFQTIRTSQERALLQHRYKKQLQGQAQQRLWLDAALFAHERGDDWRAVIAQAQADGVEIDDQDLVRAVDQIDQGPGERSIQNLPVHLRPRGGSPR